MNHSISTPKNGSTSDIDFSALMTFEPVMTKEQLETAFDVFNSHAAIIRLALTILTKTPQELIDGYQANPDAFTRLLEDVGAVEGYMPTLQELLGSAFSRLMVVGGHLFLEGGAE